MSTLQKDAVKIRVTDIVKRFAPSLDATSTIVNNDPLATGRLSSIAIVDVMLSIEAEFDIMIPQRDLTPENFSSIERVTDLVSHLRGDAVFVAPPA
jgi:acyl carrier protein